MSDTPEFMTHERIMTGEEYVSYSDYLSLQRERDEAQYKLEDARQSLEVALGDLSEAKRERDELLDRNAKLRDIADRALMLNQSQ
jgi:phage shock protein A